MKLDKAVVNVLKLFKVNETVGMISYIHTEQHSYDCKFPFVSHAWTTASRITCSQVTMYSLKRTLV